MRIQHNGLCIRNAGKADCAQLAAWWNDGAVMAHAGFPLGLGTTAEKIEKEIAGDSDDGRRRLVVEYQGRLIGEMSFTLFQNRTAEIGIKICEKDYQNRGLGRQLLRMLIGELFTRGTEKIVLDTNLENKRAQHVYELLGFRKIRINENSWVDQLGRPQSSVDYELTKSAFYGEV